MKRNTKILATTITSLALGLSCCFAGCVSTKDAGKKPENPAAAQTKFTELKTTQAVYGFSAASAGMLIQSAAPSIARQASPYAFPVKSAAANTTNSSDSAPNPESTPTTPDSSDAELQELNGYMSLVGSLLGDGAFKTQTEVSDLTEYSVKAVVSYTDFDGNPLQYVLYYNEIAESGAAAASEDEQKNHESENNKEDDEDGESGEEQESKEKYSIQGIMLIGENRYPLDGRRVLETEGSESENKTSLVVTISETDRIEVEQKTEAEEGELEQKFIYSTYKNNVLVEKTSFSFESEEGETELKMQTLKDGVTNTFRFDSEVEDGQEKMVLRIGDKSAAKKYRVTVVTDENGLKKYQYTEIGKK